VETAVPGAKLSEKSSVWRQYLCSLQMMSSDASLEEGAYVLMRLERLNSIRQCDRQPRASKACAGGLGNAKMM
jgi:hypothetical protein